MKRGLQIAVVSTVLAFGSVSPAHAVNKDMVQLQAQIQQLQDSVARLQQANDERMGVLKDLVQQTADAVNKMTVAMGDMKLQMQNQADASAAKSDQLAGQIQALNDSLDELKARMTRMEKTLGDIQSQQQQANATLQGMPQTQTTATPAAAPSSPSPATGQALPMPSGSESAPAPAAASAPPVSAAGPTSGEMYRTAYSDYMSGKNALASSEFMDLIKAYPDDNLSGNAYFYLGEMNFRSNKPSVAIKDYDHTIEHYPNNSKIPAAHLHKAEALKQTGQPEAANREFHALITRFPTSPEASQAKAKLAHAR